MKEDTTGKKSDAQKFGMQFYMWQLGQADPVSSRAFVGLFRDLQHVVQFIASVLIFCVIYDSRIAGD